MIHAVSFMIACILTALLVCVLYPIAVLFYLIGQIGKIVGIISDWIFTKANDSVKYLWKDLRSSSELF